MRAVLIKEFGKDFAIEEADNPRLKEEEALVRVKGSCLCAADHKIRDGRMPTLKLPHIPGHEGAGEVVEIGQGVRKIKVGDRVVVYMYTVCGECHACMSGRENLCVNIIRLGIDVPGCHAEYVAVPERQLIPLPDSIPYEQAAAIPDAICTCLHAIRERGQVKLNDYVVVLGIGGLGVHGVQIARLSGGRVIAISRTEEKLKAAEDFGAEWVFNGDDEKLVDKILEVTDGRGADVVIDLVGTQEMFQASIDFSKKGGIIVPVGSTMPELSFMVGQVMFKEISINPSIGMTKQGMIDGIDLIEAGKIKPCVTEEYPLEGITEAAERLKAGKTVGRSVIIP
jgi:2-desacetyl-2-hydroxyethyl bacteriochlorophyllide A dehydrogenase